ncbi:helix-turn-helix domain-containing protein [Pseudomonas sp. NPDC088444]|uniref:helix-turn-helix domain-containing protein n=1 Tax=Pseudomonas sp. NPDC088444 TaxID=3364456 RepID=UPI00384AB28C
MIATSQACGLAHGRRTVCALPGLIAEAGAELAKRLATALDRLEQGQALGAVARELGYASPSAFSAMFRRVMGESPRAFLSRE